MSYYKLYKKYKFKYKNIIEGGTNKLNRQHEDTLYNIHQYLGSNELALTSSVNSQLKLEQPYQRGDTDYLNACNSIKKTPYSRGDFCPESKNAIYKNKRYKCCLGLSREDVAKIFYKSYLNAISEQENMGITTTRDMIEYLIKSNPDLDPETTLMDYSRSVVNNEIYFGDKEYISFNDFYNQVYNTRMINPPPNISHIYNMLFRSLPPNQSLIKRPPLKSIKK